MPFSFHNCITYDLANNHYLFDNKYSKSALPRRTRQTFVDAVYSKIRLILDRDYNVKSPADVIHWDIDKKIAALHDLMSKSSATMAQVAKYLHLSIIEDKGAD